MRTRPQRAFHHALALRLGMTVGRLMRECSSAEMTDWAAYFVIERERREKPAEADVDAAAVMRAFGCG